MKIVDIKKVNKESIRYDLEIAKNENFFANNILVHNCSMTVYLNNDHFGVCSRNLELKDRDTNSFWNAAKKYELESILRTVGKNLAIQGELIGSGIQGNPYKLQGHAFYVFEIYDIDARRYLSSAERHAFCNVHDLKHVQHVPTFSTTHVLTETIDELLQFAEAKSMLNSSTEREGVSFKCNEHTDLAFKCISNKFLLKHQ